MHHVAPHSSVGASCCTTQISRCIMLHHTDQSVHHVAPHRSVGASCCTTQISRCIMLHHTDQSVHHVAPHRSVGASCCTTQIIHHLILKILHKNNSIISTVQNIKSITIHTYTCYCTMELVRKIKHAAACYCAYYLFVSKLMRSSDGVGTDRPEVWLLLIIPGAWMYPEPS